MSRSGRQGWRPDTVFKPRSKAMIDHAKKALPLVGGSLLLALALSGCDRQADQTVPPAANSVAATPVLTDSGNAADAAPTDAMSNQAEMERHHRQAMDHHAMYAEESRVSTACVSTCRSRRTTAIYNKNTTVWYNP